MRVRVVVPGGRGDERFSPDLGGQVVVARAVEGDFGVGDGACAG